MKFLATWVERGGLVRGQTCKTIDDAKRLFDHVKSTDAEYIEIRKLGGRVMHWNNPVKPEPVAAPPETTDADLLAVMTGKRELH